VPIGLVRLRRARAGRASSNPRPLATGWHLIPGGRGGDFGSSPSQTIRQATGIGAVFLRSADRVGDASL